MAAAEEKCDMMTIADIDEQLAKQLANELFEKGFIKKGKASDVTSVINDFKIMKPKTPANFNGKKPDRDATLIKKLIPFAGKCIDGRCQALNNNHGLFNQCDKKPVGKSLYCKGCNSPNATSGLTKVQTCGTVQDRIDQYEEHGDLKKHLKLILKFLKSVWKFLYLSEDAKQVLRILHQHPVMVKHPKRSNEDDLRRITLIMLNKQLNNLLI